MSRLLPDRIASRIILILFLGLTVSHLISIIVFTSERLETIAPLDLPVLVDRIALISRQLSALPEPYHDAVITAADSPLLHVTRATAADPIGVIGAIDAPASPAADRITATLDRLLGDLPVVIERVRVHPLSRDESLSTPLRWLMLLQAQVVHWMHDDAVDLDLAVRIRISGQTSVSFVNHPLARHPPLLGHEGLSVLIMVLSTFLFSLVVVWHLTVPLQEVARAAERLGKDIPAPHLAETGPLEVRAVARAFNDMNRRIRQFVEDRTRMIAAISHDLRTPITLLRLRTEFIPDLEEQARMRATLADMEAMIAATLAFARDDAADEPRQRVDLAGLLSSICYDMADAGLPVGFEPPGKVSLDCRPAALRRALTNLIDNAVKYGGGAAVSLTARAAEVEIAIEDPGPGIPEAEQERVFMPFYRLEPSRNPESGGVGLGLSVARTVIHAHGGTIGLANRLEGGLRVTLTLPRDPAPA